MIKMKAGTQSLLVALLLLPVLLLQPARAQCVPNCGCSVVQDCCLEVTENDNPITVIGRDDSSELMARIANYTNPIYRLSDEISSPNARAAFMVDASTGNIATKRALDREGETFRTQGLSFEQSGYCIQIGIEITDMDMSIRVTRNLLNVKVVDVNDNPPRFQQESFELMIDETTTSDPVLECSDDIIDRLTAVDVDEEGNNAFTYRVEGNSNFRVPDPNSPCVENNEAVVLDRENGPANYSFTLVAADSNNISLSSQAMVTYILQDINDNAPVFENATYNYPIREDLEPPAFILQLRATDADLGSNSQSSLTYSLEDSNLLNVSVSQSGSLTLQRKVDAENDQGVLSLMFTVLAGDGEGMVGRAKVNLIILDVNEPAEVSFSDSSVSIPENEVIRTVTSIGIIDDDKTEQNRNNTIRVSTGNESFGISKFGSFVFLTQTAPLDFEEGNIFQVVLQTTEYGTPVITQYFTYNITVADKNDNAPSLTQTLFSFPETDQDEVIVDLSQYVFDADSGDNQHIESYQLEDVTCSCMQNMTDFSLIELDEGTGVLRSGEFHIDREEMSALHFIVNVTDGGSPSLSQLLNFTVEISDINDNLPIFEQTAYTFHLMEGEPTETFVGRVEASDPDYLENGTIIYSIVDQPDIIEQFNIEVRTGRITSGARFDREKQDKYDITIEAHDNGREPNFAAMNAMVTIIIDDVDDNDPMFASDEEMFSITTDLEAGGEVGTVEASDNDEAPFNTTIYRIESNTTIFSIAQNSGNIILVASDEEMFSITTDLEAGGKVGTVEASDNDEAPFIYRIESNTTIFSIAQNSGNIILVEPQSIPNVFMLNISAFNPGKEESKDTILVTIKVEQAPASIVLIGGVAGGAAFLIILIFIMIILILCVCCRNRKYKRKYAMNKAGNLLNNAQQRSILKKIPTTATTANGQQQKSREVTFNESVQETHYDEQSVITDVDNTFQKESITKFDNSPQPHHFSDDEEEEASVLSEWATRQPQDLVDVVELDMSQLRNLWLLTEAAI